VDEAFKALQSIHDAKAGAAKNPTLNEYAQLVAVDTHATKVMNKVYSSWSRAVDTLNANIAKMDKELNAPVEQRATASSSLRVTAEPQRGQAAGISKVEAEFTSLSWS